MTVPLPGERLLPTRYVPWPNRRDSPWWDKSIRLGRGFLDGVSINVSGCSPNFFPPLTFGMSLDTDLEQVRRFSNRRTCSLDITWSYPSYYMFSDRTTYMVKCPNFAAGTWKRFPAPADLTEENHMEIDTESQKYIPIDIGRSFISEVTAYYSRIFGFLPEEYHTYIYNNDFSDSTGVYLKMRESMENVERRFTVLNRFVYRASGAELKTVGVRGEEIGEVNYVIEGGILLNLNILYKGVVVFYRTKEQLDSVMGCLEFQKKRRKKERARFQLLNCSQGVWRTTDLTLKDFSIDVGANYNDDLPASQIDEFLHEKTSSGLILLHGEPGTGKTYYIRNLIKTNPKLSFIYMNKEALLHINDSSFVQFLIEHRNSIFILEDCESVLADRNGFNSAISTLLNLSDGIIGDAFNNKFICTFNTDIRNVDKALLRKGRMRMCYEFGKLKKDKANALAEKMGVDARFDSDTPLCEVMNLVSNGRERIRGDSKVGF